VLMSHAGGAIGITGAGDLTLNGSVGIDNTTNAAPTKNGNGTLTLVGSTDN
jgi:hypothetical protein